MCTARVARFVLAILLSLGFFGAYANESAPPAAGHGDAGAAAAKPSGKGNERPSDSLPDWVDVEAKIAELSAKIKNKESVIQKLIQEKKDLPSDSPKIKDLIKEIVREHKELQASIQEYEKKRAILKYRFPERGMKIERKYKKVQAKSLDEVEASVGVEGKLNRNLKRMRSQYGRNQNSDNESLDPNMATPVTQPKQGTIEDQDPIIIQK